MDDKVNYALVGAFVLGLGTALIAAVLWLAAGMGGKRSYEPYQAVIQESVAGLNVEAPVKYLGVDVGKVREIGIDPNNPSHVRLLFMIQRGTPIKQNTVAVLKTQGLTGIAYVELSGGGADSPALTAPEGEIPIIRTAPSLSARLENVFTTVLAGLGRTSANLNAVFDAENRDALRKVLANVAELTQALAAQRQAISAGIADASRTTANAARASEQLAPLIARLAKSADAVENMARDVASASTDVGRAADTAGSGVAQLSSQTLPELQQLLAELQTLAGSLRRLSEQTERDPGSLLFGNRNPTLGPGEKAPP